MAETSKEPEEEKKSSKKLIFIIAGVLLLAAIGGGAYFFMGDSSEETEKDTEKAEASEPPKDAFYFEMVPSFVTNFPKEKDERLFQVSIAILANNEETIEAIKKHEPKIRNNFLLVLTSQDLQQLKTTEGKNKLRESLKQELLLILKETHQEQGFDEMFFTSFVMQ
ncbi:MAG: flagellar basal body-associated FliL family protein [Methylococcaceae bacterium]